MLEVQSLLSRSCRLVPAPHLDPLPTPLHLDLGHDPLLDLGHISVLPTLSWCLY